jgi:hypothetical protein
MFASAVTFRVLYASLRYKCTLYEELPTLWEVDVNRGLNRINSSGVGPSVRSKAVLCNIQKPLIEDHIIRTAYKIGDLAIIFKIH